MGSQVYETRLKKEFELLQKLERHPNVKNIINIYYIDRLRGGTYKSISETPGSLYPYQFKVKYTMPMYIGEGQLKRDWTASFIFETPEDILMDPDSKLGVDIDGNNGNFAEDYKPFNNHVSPGWVCTGTCWGVANQGFGIWYFIISLGALFNLDKFIMASEDKDETSHLNTDAFRYWKNVRNMQPTNKIDWPFKLMDEATFGEVTAKSSTFSFGEKNTTTKPKFSFGEKKVGEKKVSTFSFGPKS